MLCEAAVYSSRRSSSMAAAHSATRHATASLDLISEEGRTVLSRQGSLTPASPQLDRRNRQQSSNAKVGGLGGGASTIRRSVSLGSGLSGFLGDVSSRKMLEENSSMRRSGSRGCLESLESSSNLKAMLDEVGDEDRHEREEEDSAMEWGLKSLESPRRRGGSVIQKEMKFFPTQFRAPEWQSFGSGGGGGGGGRATKGPDELRWNSSSEGKKMKGEEMRSVVAEEARGALDSLKDRLNSSLKMQPECSYYNPDVSSCSSSQGPPAKEFFVHSTARPGVGASMMTMGGGANAVVSGLGREVDCVSLPISLRRLKRRNSHGKKLSAMVAPSRTCGIQTAFSSMVYIIKAMHGHALESHQSVYGENLGRLVTPVHKEMQLSFVWLFQQVFARTPEFMLSTMVLLANFTVYSLGENVALAAAAAMATTSPDAAGSSQPVKLTSLPADGEETHVKSVDAPFLGREGCYRGQKETQPQVDRNSSSRPAKGLSRSQSMKQGRDSEHMSMENGNLDAAMPAADDLVLRAFMRESLKQMESSSGWLAPVQIDREVSRKLVAPVQASISPDNYICYDRTDLEYQHALDLEPVNVLLLANYAQFLYLVRHDNNRYCRHGLKFSSLKTFLSIVHVVKKARVKICAPFFLMAAFLVRKGLLFLPESHFT